MFTEFFSVSHAWGEIWVGNDKGNISNEWTLASVSDCPDLQEEGFCDEKESDENPSPHLAPEIESQSYEIQETGCDSGCCGPKDTTIIQGGNPESTAWEMSGKPVKLCCSLIDNYCSYYAAVSRSTASTSLEEQETWNEILDRTLTVSPPLASKTRVLEALMSYPVSSGVTALLERRDIYALSLSCAAIFYALNIQDLVSHRAIISRCIRKCHGSYMGGLPEYVIAPRPSEHYKMAEEGKDMSIRECVRKRCWNDVCKRVNDDVDGSVATAYQEGKRLMRRSQNARAPPLAKYIV
ncbi:hypothetical protein B9Z19DRAFT_1121598 [Tuber borchii]|uniref:Uncharacterized protein n=1 Tax=Tuber borchii TaxID=42251 RepID=A0A2T7A270_TUBBO|nr:hypothetical protein B9Z19DRAFT_1121598 [Tuber borchii]